MSQHALVAGVLSSSCLESRAEEHLMAASEPAESVLSVEVCGRALEVGGEGGAERKWEIDVSSCHSWPHLGHASRLSEEIVPCKWQKLCTAGP